MELMDLPDVCLREVVKRLPFRDQMNICLVCRQLYTVHQSILKTLCERITSLRIDAPVSKYAYQIADFDFYKLDAHHDLYVKLCGERIKLNEMTPFSFFPTVFSRNVNNQEVTEYTRRYDFYLDESNILELSQKFPNIRRLTLFNSMNYVDVSLWSSVTDIKLVGLYEPEKLETQLNKLKLVKNLSIEMELENVAQLEIMPQLKELTCRLEPSKRKGTKFWSEKVNQIIKTSAQNLEATGLWIEHFDSGKFDFSDTVLHKLSRLTYRQPMTMTDFDWIADHFLNLTFLDIELPVKTSSSLAHMISQLPKLSKLSELNFCFHSKALYDDHLTQAASTLPPVTSIKKLKAQFKVEDVHSLHLLASIFPNAHQIIFIISSLIYSSFKTQNCQKESCICSKVQLLLEKCQSSKARTILLPVVSEEIGQMSFLLHIT